jgi:predicted RNase H-like nuclease
MRNVMGVDGCGGGWVTVRHSEDGALEVKRIETLEEVHPLPDVIAIDIPIGLTEHGPRECDELARQFIGPRASSVFPAPVRDVLRCENYETANRTSMERQGKGISQQCFAITPRICEIDELLQRDARIRERTYEVHPEVSFTAWLGEHVPFAKKTEEGKALRMELVESFFGRYAYTFAREFLPRTVKDDDILDAFAATWTAWRIAADIAESLPTLPPRDEKGLEMAIWF